MTDALEPTEKPLQTAERFLFLWETEVMRTTVDLPDVLFRKTKATAALRGSTMKELIVQAVDKEVNAQIAKPGKRVKLPLVRLPKGSKMNLRGFDFDDLLA